MKTTHDLVALPVAQPEFPAERFVASVESATGGFYVSLFFPEGKSKVSIPNDHGCTLHIDISEDAGVYGRLEHLIAGRRALCIRGSD